MTNGILKNTPGFSGNKRSVVGRKTDVTADPYVISEDLLEAFTGWSKMKEVQIPSQKFFSDIVSEIKVALNDIFPNVRVICGNDLARGLAKAYLKRVCIRNTAPLVTLDKVILPSFEWFPSSEFGYLDVTRAVDEKFETYGLISREGGFGLAMGRSRPLQTAIAEVAARYSNQKQKITLFDDVIFSGATISSVISTFQENGISVKEVVAAIAIGNTDITVQVNNVPVIAVYKFDGVIDEVCCRDFIVGTPFGGRTVVLNDKARPGKLAYAPYLLPYGCPEKWASIPAGKTRRLSEAMLNLSAVMWGEIERINRRKIGTNELDFPIYRMENSKSIARTLKETARRLSECRP